MDSLSVPLFASFALPLVAAGAAVAAVAVPVLIHWLSRQRYQVVRWAAIRFLLAAQKQHRRKIDRWLLLVLRMLVLLLILGSMCAVSPWAERFWQRVRPGPLETVSSVQRTHHIFLVDGSLSMTTAVEGGGTRFDRAISQLEKQLEQASPGDGFTLIFLAGNAQAIVPGPTNDAAKVLAEVKALKVTHGTADTSAGLSLVADTLGRSPRNYPRRQVTIFSDAQRSAWAPLLTKTDNALPEIWKRILPRADVVVVDVAGADVDNLAVVDVALGDPLALVDSPTAVSATIHNFGRTDRKQVRVELHMGRPSASGAESTMVAVDQRSISSLPSGQRASVVFPLVGASRFREAGLHFLQVKLVEGDDLPADDSRTIAVEVRESLPVLIVNGKTGAEPLRAAGAYVLKALDPTGARLAINPARARMVPPAVFADPALTDLSEYDCIFLCDVPPPSEATVARLEAHLKRGGGLVIGLGPTAAANIDAYNRVLFQDGNGLLPGKLIGVKTSATPDGADFRLAGDDLAFRRPPLAVFANDRDRAGLTDVPFRQYLRLDAPKGGRAERILSFVPAGTAAEKKEPGAVPDPAVVEFSRQRGRIVVVTSSLNTDWNEWPILPSFLPFIHETLRFVASSPNRYTLQVGEPIEDLVPVISVGTTATVTTPEGQSTVVPVVAGDETAIVRYAETTRSGLYHISLGGRRGRSIAVNVPESTPGGGSESDLLRVDSQKSKDFGEIQVVSDPGEAVFRDADGVLAVLTPRPHGPTIARWLATLALLLTAIELWLAWRVGPARSAIASSPTTTADQRSRLSLLLSLSLALVLLAFAAAIVGTIIHVEAGGQPLGFLPESLRHGLEKTMGVPAAGPGEGIRWRLESAPAYLANARDDRRVLMSLAAAVGLLIVGLYALERRATRSWRQLLAPALLRLMEVFLLTFVLLPQQRLAFDREGWPDVAVLLDTSVSMATVDELRDPAVRAKAAELAATTDMSSVDRLRLAKQILTRKDGEWLTRLFTERQVKVHLYSIADQARLVKSITEANELVEARDAVSQLAADGESSRLGDGVESVLKAFRGGSLAAIVAFTDGITTAGDDLPRASREAARAGVPLYLVGLGDSTDPPDLLISDVKCDDEVLKGDRLEIQARVTARGPNPPSSVPVVLYERVGETLIERGRQTVSPDAAGKPVRLQHTPTEVGEKTYVIDVPVQAGEVETGNNRIERTVLVTESKRLKVLYIDGYPRYEFRFVKALLEREIDSVRGNKSVELSTILLDASPGYSDLDKSALATFPTKTQLASYDVVILGDVTPSQLPRANQLFTDLAEFVKVHGGGLMFLAGEHGNPHLLFDTPLADLLPIVPTDAAARQPPTLESSPIVTSYNLRMTPQGRSHPLLRFATEEADNNRIWAGLKPFFWQATGYKKKPAAEVLAVHPERAAEGEPGSSHPLILQQFVGAGRVIFFGFDETWRWRFRGGEERFNQFWTQAVRAVARSKVVRIELRTDKQTAYRRDEPIRITVRFPDDSPAPAPESSIRVLVARKPLAAAKGRPGLPGQSESYTVQLAKVEDTRATYQTLLTRTPEGEYAFTLTDPKPLTLDGKTTANPPRAEASVLPPPGERDRLEMNRGDLLRAADISRGKFYTLADVAKLIDDLPEVTRLPLNQPCPPLMLWNQSAMYMLLLGLFAIEWWLRRRERLV